MNNWAFTGNLGKDCEVSTTQGGTAVCKFTVAVKSGFGDNAKTTWTNCRLYGKRAEGQLTQYLTKGQQVAITGEAELAEWEYNGATNKALMVRVSTLDLIGGQNASQSRQQAPQQTGYQQPANNYQSQPAPTHQAQPAPAAMEAGYEDDDIPF